MALARWGTWAVALLAAACVAGTARAAAKAETAAERDARMAWWREARFGMFIHWGLYALPAGTWKGERTPWSSEWIMNRSRIPVAEYAGLAARFNPTRFDADAWARLAKAAGMKYVIVTAKHHDGFAMFHTRIDGFNVVDATPFKRDPLAELAAACRRHGLKLGVYYSHSQDWHHAGGAIAHGPAWDKAQEGDYDGYLERVAVPQVRELLTNYGPVAVLWWDTPEQMTPRRAARFRALLELQPGIVTNDRLGGGHAGDTGTPEQTIPAGGLPGRDWETCMSINDSWGFRADDQNYKSTRTLVRNLIDIASKGGNYLLNVGPTAEGEIPKPQVERLRGVGAWLRENGEAIYGTSAGPFRQRLGWGRATQKDGRLYLHVFDWPADGRLRVPILNKDAKAWLLASPQALLKVAADREGLVVQVPRRAPDPLATVVVVQPAAPVRLAPVAPPSPAGDGTLVLSAADAEIVGKTARLEGGEAENIGWWTDPEDYVRWRARVQPGRYRVSLAYACEPESAGSEISVEVGGRRLTGTVAATGGWDDYRVLELGTVEVAGEGPVPITVRPVAVPKGVVMNLRSITFAPEPRK